MHLRTATAAHDLPTFGIGTRASGSAVITTITTRTTRTVRPVVFA